MDYGILSLIPPLVAIVLAILTRQVLLSLFAGIFSAQFIIHKYDFIVALDQSIVNVVGIFKEDWAVYTILFSFLVGSVLTLSQASGGVEGFINFVTIKNKYVTNGKKSLLLAYILGVVLFIESSIKILLSGIITRPLTDKYKISREKLAYVCDSTAASMCALFPLNGWGATIVGIITVQINQGTIEGNPIEILISSLTYQFYSIITVVFCLYYILTNKDWGLMKKAERRASEGKVLNDDSTPMFSEEAINEKMKKGLKPQMRNMLIPILSMFILMPTFLIITGNGNLMNGNGSKSIFLSVLGSIVISSLYFLIKRIFKLKEIMNYCYQGIGSMVPVASIIILAFTIGNSISEIGTGHYIASLFEQNLNGGFAPAIIFLLASITAFSTGTSWGTFAIFIPIAIQIATQVDLNSSLAIGAAVSGSIMGDHCSPISDSTILSSMSCSTDHIDHVKTQIPYALLSASAALVLYLIVGLF